MMTSDRMDIECCVCGAEASVYMGPGDRDFGDSIRRLGWRLLEDDSQFEEVRVHLCPKHRIVDAAPGSAQELPDAAPVPDDPASKLVELREASIALYRQLGPLTDQGAWACGELGCDTQVETAVWRRFCAAIGMEPFAP